MKNIIKEVWAESVASKIIYDDVFLYWLTADQLL